MDLNIYKNYNIKGKDYYMVRYQYDDTKGDKPSSVYMKKWQRHVQFLSKFYKEYTGKTWEDWNMIYMSETVDCVSDELDDMFGILIYSDSMRGCYTMLIPKDKHEMYGFLIHLLVEFGYSYKILKKINLGAFRYRKYPYTWRRESSLEMAKIWQKNSEKYAKKDTR